MQENRKDFEYFSLNIANSVSNRDVDSIIALCDDFIALLPASGKIEWVALSLSKSLMGLGARGSASDFIQKVLVLIENRRVVSELMNLAFVSDASELNVETVLNRLEELYAHDAIRIHSAQSAFQRVLALTGMGEAQTRSEAVAAAIGTEPKSVIETGGEVRQISTVGPAEFKEPENLNGVNYSIRGLIGRDVRRPALNLCVIPKGAVLKRRAGIAIMHQERPVAGAGNVQGVFDVRFAKVEPQERIEGDAIMVLDMFVTPNYCHWLTDSLHRAISLSNEFGLVRNNVKILVHKKTPYITRTLKIFNFREENIVELGENSNISADRLFYSSSSFEDLRHPAQYGAFEIVNDIPDEIVRTVCGRKPRAKRRIYISRGDVGRRELVNENSLIACLERYGYETIQPGTLSFDEQVALFAETESIIGIHGAGLTNLLFADHEAHVLEIFPARYGTPGFFVPSVARGQRYTCMIGEGGGNTAPGEINSTFATENVVIDENHIEKYCDELFG